MILKNCRKEAAAQIRAGVFEAEVAVQHILLPPYSGPGPQSTWRKPVVGPPNRPFAELQIVDGLEDAGWQAAWVYRPGKFVSSWEPRVVAELPADAVKLHKRIGTAAGARAGSWDVFAWKTGRPLFVELKRAGSSDRIRASQLIWREAALRLGVQSESFIIAEWSGG